MPVLNAKANQNADVLLRVFSEILNGTSEHNAYFYFSDGYFSHDHAKREGLEGPKQFLRLVNAVKSIAPYIEYTIERCIGSDGLVSVIWRAAGVHRGLGAGVPPSNRQIEIDGLFVAKLVRGKIAESWGDLGLLRLLQSVGATQANPQNLLDPSAGEVTPRVAGPLTGRPVVLIGGMACPGWMTWTAVTNRLTKTRPVINLDSIAIKYGFYNEALPQEYSVDLEIDGIRNALVSLHQEGPFDLVGWSFGATVALGLALQFPQLVRTLTLIEPSTTWVLSPCERLSPVVVRYIEGTMADCSGDIDMARLGRRYRECKLLKPGRFKKNPSYYAYYAFREAFHNRPVLLQHQGDLEALRRMSTPTLLFQGTHSLPVYKVIMAALRRNIPDCRLVELPTGHAVFRDEADRFMACLEDFWDR